MKSRLPRLGAVCLLIPLGACMNLSGIGGESKYACKAPDGVACDSVSGTYANAIHNNLPSQLTHRATPTQKMESEARPTRASAASARATSSTAAGDSNAVVMPSPLRSQTRILRLWIKPWEDADGDLYDQGYVYVQIDNGQWLIDHLQRQIRDAYAPLKAPPKPPAEATGDQNSNANTPTAPTLLRPPFARTDADRTQ